MRGRRCPLAIPSCSDWERHPERRALAGSVCSSSAASSSSHSRLTIARPMPSRGRSDSCAARDTSVGAGAGCSRRGRRRSLHALRVARGRVQRRRQRRGRRRAQARAPSPARTASSARPPTLTFPSHLDAAVLRVLKRVQQQVLRDAAHLHAIALDDERRRTFGRQGRGRARRPSLARRRTARPAPPPRRRAGLAPLLAGVEPRLRREVVQQRVQRRDAALEHMQRLLERRRRRRLDLQHAGDVLHDAQVSAQVMCRFAPGFGALLLETRQLPMRVLERQQPGRRVRRAANAHTATRSRSCPLTRNSDTRRHAVDMTPRLEVRARGCVALELVGEARVEPNPLAHHFLLVVALLPALQAMALGVGRLVLCRRRACRRCSVDSSLRCNASSIGGMWSKNCARDSVVAAVICGSCCAARLHASRIWERRDSRWAAST